MSRQVSSNRFAGRASGRLSNLPPGRPEDREGGTMTKYYVGHTTDQLGGRYFEPPETEAQSLDDAVQRAQAYSDNGQCGYVRRDDGAILAPDGSWISTAGEEE